MWKHAILQQGLSARSAQHIELFLNIINLFLYHLARFYFFFPRSLPPPTTTTIKNCTTNLFLAFILHMLHLLCSFLISPFDYFDSWLFSARLFELHTSINGGQKTPINPSVHEYEAQIFSNCCWFGCAATWCVLLLLLLLLWCAAGCLFCCRNCMTAKRQMCVVYVCGIHTLTYAHT